MSKPYSEMTNAEKYEYLMAHPTAGWLMVIKKLVFVGIGILAFCLILKAIRKSVK